jgi:hypothetical protein
VEICHCSVPSFRVEGPHFEGTARDADGDFADEAVVDMIEELCEHLWFTFESTAGGRGVIEHRIDHICVLVDEAMCAEDA